MLDYIRFVFEFLKAMRSASKDFKSKNEWLKKFPLEQELNPGCEVKTKHIPLEFSPAITKNLISDCKRHGVTVHGAVCTVLGICVAEMLQDGELSEDMNVTQCSSVGLRRWFPDELQHQGLACYYSLFVQCPCLH